jgi:hypothetical protein
MKQRIKQILSDPRFEILIYTDSRFYGAKLKLKNNHVTDDYLSDIENHLKFIDPHYQTITVNGEDVPVHFQTRGSDG